MTAVRLTPAPLRGAPVRLRVDDRNVDAYPGETLAAALMAAGVLRLRGSPRAGAPRGAFCFMGACQECLVRVDGALRQSCLLPVADGMEVSL